MLNFGFVIEQWMGHVTHHKNLAHWVAQDSEIYPTWMPIEINHNDIWERLPIIRSNGAIKLSLRARDAIRRGAAKSLPHSLDALFLHTQMVSLFAAPLMRRIPTIISQDATPINFDSIATGYQHQAGGNGFLERRKFLWYKNTYHTATALVTWSKWAKDSLVSDYGVAADKVTVIPPGVDLEAWNFQQQRANHSHQEDEKVRLLFVGADFERKGGHTLMEAFRNGLREDCTLDIVTINTDIQRQLASDQGVRVHCGLTANSAPLKELFAKADIFVFPTKADTNAIGVLEAMAAGLPIVASDVGALREEVIDGVNGFIVPPTNADKLLDAVRSLALNPDKRREMGTTSRHLAEAQFSAKDNYQKLLSLMKTISGK